MTTHRAELASYLLTAVALLAVLHLHLLPALLAGMLIYELVHMIAPRLESHLSSLRAKQVVVVLLSAALVSLCVVAVVLLLTLFRGNNGSLAALAQKMAEIIENSRQWLPEWLAANLPDGIDGIKASAAHWLREHAGEVQLVGKEAARTAAHLLIGFVIGALVALGEVSGRPQHKPLAAALLARVHILSDAFRRIVFAQVRISLLNTAFTAIYLAVVLPLAGVHLPFTKTMIAVTFIAGLLPVLGNLISNTVIVVVSLAHSPQIALASLVFLVVIHKLEYFLNARIVGSRIASRAYELLLAMLAMEAAFGIAGVIAAPVYYAYLKQELTAAGQV